MCSSLRLDPDHSEALEMREDLEIKALKYKNEVTMHVPLFLSALSSLLSIPPHVSLLPLISSILSSFLVGCAQEFVGKENGGPC